MTSRTARRPRSISLVAVFLLIAGLLVVPTAASAAPTAARSGQQAMAKAASTTDSPPLTYWGSAQQMITVVAPTGTSTTATLTAWERSAAGWRVVVGPVPAFVGAAGIGKASEGSTRTPTGVFSLGTAFGRQPNPGTAMSYFKTDVYDWWNGNSNSPQYNTHVRQTSDPGNSENLYRIGAVYDYAIDMGYNRARTPGAGSAFFLHVTNSQPTGGCVAIDRASLVRILQWLNPAKTPVINIGTAPASTRNPIGHFDNARLSGDAVTLKGWALDPDQLRGPINVHVYDYRPDGSRYGISASAQVARGDVAAAYPGTTAAHGYSVTMRIGGHGRHRVCVFAINVGRGTGNPALGCANFDIPPPVGHYDTAAVRTTGTITATGWAADPTAPGEPVAVLATVRGPKGRVEYRTVTDRSRSDVARAMPWAGGQAGFAVSLPAQSDGSHEVCLQISSVHYAPATVSLGCRTVVVRSSFGHLDAVTASAGTIKVTGWALNPNNPAEKVPIRVYDTGPAGKRGYLDVVAGGVRQDVANAFPGYGPNHGFTRTIPAEAGNHTVCVYAMTTRGGFTNPLLGCRNLVV